MARDLKEVYDQRPPMAQTLQPFADVMRRGFPNTAASVADLNARMTKAREQGGAPGTVGASFGAFQTMGRGLAQDVGGAVTKVIDPYANALKGAVTGDYTPINQAAPATASPATSMLPKGRFDPLAPQSGGQLYPMPGMERQQDWSSAKVVPTNFAAPAAPGAGGVAGVGGAGMMGDGTSPLDVKVARQANGVLSFTGKGPGAGVNYTGMPNWTSQKGGAGQGAVGSWNLGEQNDRMAAVLQGFKAEDAQKQRMDLINQIASGAGGAIGVARNKMALAGLGDMLDTQSKNATALSAAGMQTGAQLAGQKSAEGIAANRDATTKYGYEMQKETAMSAQEVEKERNGLTAAINKQKALGNPVDQQKWALEFATRTGTDLATGKKLPAAQWSTLKETANILKFGFAAPQQEGE